MSQVSQSTVIHEDVPWPNERTGLVYVVVGAGRLAREFWVRRSSVRFFILIPKFPCCFCFYSRVLDVAKLARAVGCSRVARMVLAGARAESWW